MKVLIACEYSGRVRDAFAALGHDAMSCDLLPTEAPGNHYQGDVRDVLGEQWDLLIAHPECTYLTNAFLNGVCRHELFTSKISKNQRLRKSTHTLVKRSANISSLVALSLITCSLCEIQARKTAIKKSVQSAVI